MGLKEFVSSAVDWATPKIKNFLGGAADFIGMTPKYLDEKYDKSFIKLMKKDMTGMMSKFGSDLGEDYYSLSLEDRRKVYHNFKESIRQTNAFNALEYDKFKPGSQKHIENIYSTFENPNFQDAYIDYQIGLGRRGALGSRFKNYNYDDLTDEQLSTLRKEYAEEFTKKKKRLDETYMPEGASGPNYNYGLQRKYLNSYEGKQLQSSFFGENKYSRKNNQMISDGSKEGKAVSAYKDYLDNSVNKIPETSNDTVWQAPMNFYDYATSKLGLEHEEAKRISKEIAMGNPDHSGIGLWNFVKNHPGSSVAVGMGTAWGVSELYDENEY